MMDLRRIGFGAPEWLGISALLLSAILLPFGLALDMVEVSSGIPLRVFRWEAELFQQVRAYSVFATIGELFGDGDWFLGGLIVLFCVVVPIGKLAGAGWVFARRVKTGSWPGGAVRCLGLTSKWAMVEVFAVAVTIVLLKLGEALRADVKIGLYLFAISALTGMTGIAIIEWLAGDEGRLRLGDER